MRKVEASKWLAVLLSFAHASCSNDSSKTSGTANASAGGSVGTMSSNPTASGIPVGATGAMGGVGGNTSIGTADAGGTQATSTEAGAGGSGGTPGSSATSVAASSGSGGSGGSASTANYPFPQNIVSEFCVYPSNYDNADVRAAYELWKDTVITDAGASGYLRVEKPDSGSVIGSTVSEGIGYGMLLTVYMDDQQIFDSLWQYTMLYFNGNDLMDWEVDPDGNVIGTGAALDGDEDMAWALVMADRQWGGSGSLARDYLSYAVDLINAIWDHEIDHGRDEMPLPGDSWGGADVTNISYFAPAYYRVFAEVSGNDGWLSAVDRSYEIIALSLNEEQGNANNGLVPAWCDSSGTPVEAYSGAPTHFQNDSTRTPFRVGQDYCYYGEARALAYMQKITSFYTAVGVDEIVDGYDLDGTPHPDFSTGGLQPASFVGPAGVGAMYSADNQAFIDEAYAAVATGELTAGTIYYQKSWTALSLLMMTGNFTELPGAN